MRGRYSPSFVFELLLDTKPNPLIAQSVICAPAESSPEHSEQPRLSVSCTLFKFYFAILSSSTILALTGMSQGDQMRLHTLHGTAPIQIFHRIILYLTVFPERLFPGLLRDGSGW